MRWIDVSPYDWYYRDVLDAARLYLSVDQSDTETLFNSIPYNKFVAGKERIVRSYISTENQIEFPLPGYVPSDDNPVYCYVDGVPVNVETDVDKVYLPNPISAGLQVVVMAMGVPYYETDTCRKAPVLVQAGIYPSAELAHKSKYTFDINYSLNEIATAMGQKLRRIELERYPGETVQEAMRRQVGYDRNVFTIVDGVLYTSYEYWNIPVTVQYNYKGANDQILHTAETVIPTSEVVVWNDRFFPKVNLMRGEFMVLLQRMRLNLYRRFTDREYVPYAVNERNIPDIPDGQWWTEDLMDILHEKYLDGCYVFPLYADGTFNPSGCITRAEAVTYLHRFIEWALERFR